MKRFLFSSLILILLVSARGHINYKLKIIPLMNRLEHGIDTTYVVNFWATWCKPCVAELPEFQKLDSLHPDDKTKIILMSLDFERDIQTKMLPLLKKKDIHLEVHVVDETNDNEWMPRVDGEWQGNIPATLIMNKKNKYRIFLPREITSGELDSLLKVANKKPG